MPPTSQNEGLRSRLSRRLDGLRQRLRRHSVNADGKLRKPHASGKSSDPQSILMSNQAAVVHTGLSNQVPDGIPSGNSSLDTGIQDCLMNSDGILVSETVSSDLWSAAYREAVISLGKDVDVAILRGSNVAQLFKELEDTGDEASQGSHFARGVAYLHKIQVPLETFKLALDLAAPFSNIEPTAATVVGVMRSVTAIAISFATADIQFAHQIGFMLEQMEYIDDCDTLGQRTNRNDIHKALVLVYRKILEFYKVAYDILTSRGRKLAMKMILENDRLPNVVQEFLNHAENLRKLIEKATLEVVEDIRTMLYDHEIARWLGSSKMNLQSRYHAQLQNIRSDEGCEFLLSHPKFVDWYYATNSQQLAILGEMGCGKTIAMAFLVDELARRNEHQLPRPKICYHYCRDNETGEAVYIISSLVLALLEQLSGLKKAFYDWYKESQSSGVLDPAASPQKMGEFLETAVETLDRPLFIFLDGLDECDRSSRKNLLGLLQTLLHKTSRLKIIVSLRPEAELLVQLGHAAKIDISSDAHRDAIIVRHAVEQQLSYLSADVSKLVVDTLSRMAQGSAIWTKMTVGLIEVRRITALEPMRRFLENMPLPKQLSGLYTNLILRSSSENSDNQKLIVLSLKILSVASRPLSIQELAWAVAFADAECEVATVDALAKRVDHQQLTSLIYPFVTRIDFSDVDKRQVQLVHQSVREFVRERWGALQKSAVAEASDQASISDSEESPETLILRVCVNYLLLDEIGRCNLFSEEQIAIEALPQEYDLFSDRTSFEYDVRCTWEKWEEDMIRYDPRPRGFGEFFVYASSNWLKHFGALDQKPLPLLAQIERLCQAGSIRLRNWTSQNCRPDCAIKARFDFDSRLYDPLGIAALYGSDASFRNMLENSTFDPDKYLPLPALAAADQILQWGDLSRLEILFLDNRLGHQLRNLDFFRLVVRRWFHIGNRHDNWDVAFGLVDYVTDQLVEEKWGSELFSVAVRAGCTPLCNRLLSRAQIRPQLKDELLRGAQSIEQKVLKGEAGTLGCLLAEPDFEAKL